MKIILRLTGKHLYKTRIHSHYGNYTKLRHNFDNTLYRGK